MFTTPHTVWLTKQTTTAAASKRIWCYARQISAITGSPARQPNAVNFHIPSTLCTSVTTKGNTLNDSRLRLYADAQFVSPYALSVYVALQEKRLEFDLLTVDLGSGANYEAIYAAKSLTQRVPTLVHGDFALSKSSAITEYLDAAFTETLVYPQDRYFRARARQVQAWLRSDLMPIRQERSTESVFYGKFGESLSPAAEAAAHKLYSVVEALLSNDTLNLFGNGVLPIRIWR